MEPIIAIANHRPTYDFRFTCIAITFLPFVSICVFNNLCSIDIYQSSRTKQVINNTRFCFHHGSDCRMLRESRCSNKTRYNTEMMIDCINQFKACCFFITIYTADYVFIIEVFYIEFIVCEVQCTCGIELTTFDNRDD